MGGAKLYSQFVDSDGQNVKYHYHEADELSRVVVYS